MRIRIISKTGYTNPARGLELKFNQLADVDDRLAVKLFTHHIAVAVRDIPIERAVKTPPENTAKRVSKPKEGARKRTFSSPKE